MSDVDVKKGFLQRFQFDFPNEEIVCVFDDRQRVVDFWRSQGLECYQVDKWEEVGAK
jgi:hypothetical protein